ncbi:DNA-processing protein DprA [Sphingoaurantiacus capsulatus]|uniref:DNA-processing protein DprA n=1 Tax=Sphingoaurantiacus capsulatus TaxID=1771310 RepID=A0ABV7X6R9_9SPHN
MADAPSASEAERIARLRLIRSENVGPVTFRQLITRFGNGRAALDALPELARRGGRKSLRIATAADAEREMAAVERFGGRLLFWGLALYPRLLAEIDDAPPVLAMRGDVRLLDRPAVAMVGARNASAAAIRFARGMAADLAAEGVVVVSGLARGIDAAAHTGALDGGTVGVIAGGLDIVYPPENADLHEQLFAQGLVVAEQPLGVEPQARHFPRRNRIISGLSQGVVIVEAAPKSGSLITARFAGEQGREVMAVPGSPLDPRAQGCNLLIRDGATLVQSAADVLESLGPIGGSRAATPPAPPFSPAPVAEAGEAERDAVIALLGPVAVPVDELIRLSNLPPAVVQTILLELEIGGRLVRHAGGRVALS